MNHFPVPVKVTFNMRIKRPAGKTKAPQKLQSVLFSYYLIIPMIVMIAFSVFFYKYVSDILISRESNSLNTLNSSISDRLDSTITDLDYTSANINYAARRSNAFSEFFDHNTSSESLSNIADLAVAINGTDLKISTTSRAARSALECSTKMIQLICPSSPGWMTPKNSMAANS